MASNKIFTLAIVAIVLPTVAMATEYIVGDSNGWTNGYNYTNWAIGKVFYVGDTLVFQYKPPNHNVFKVDAAGFKDCIKPPVNNALTSGNDSITLGIPGKKWYICGIGTHCAEFDQKLVINVLSAAPGQAPTSPTKSDANGIISSGYQVIMAAMTAVAMIMV